MAIVFHPLPVQVFPEPARPHIARLNTELRDLFTLEASLSASQATVRRSDLSVTRRQEKQVHITRITPDVLPAVSGASSVIGVPALTLGTVNAIGTTNTVVSIDSSIAVFDTTTPEGVSTSSAVGTVAFAARRDHVHSTADVLANPTASVGLAAVNGSAGTVMRSDAAPALDQGIVPTWAGVHTFTPRPVFSAGTNLSTSGVVESDVADGASAIAFEFDDTIGRTQGRACRIRNSIDDRILMDITYDGLFAFGYAQTVSQDAGHILSFNQSDIDSPTGSPHFVGIRALIRHVDTAETVTDLIGMLGIASAETATGLSPDIVVGTAGVGVGTEDATGYSAKALVALRGHLSGDTGLASTEPDQDPLMTPGAVVRGDWDIIAGCWTDYVAPSSAKGLPSNRPQEAIGGRFAIMGFTATGAGSRQTGIRIVAPTAGVPQTPADAEAIRAAYPARGTRRTHILLEPFAAPSGNPTGNASGDLYFDDGTNNTAGLWEHAGASWQKLARLGIAEVVSGAWEFTAETRFNNNSLALDNPAQTFQYLQATSAIVADRTITWPLLAADDTLVFEAFSQALTNKDLNASTNSVRRTKAITIEDPTATEDITCFFVDKAVTLVQVRAVLVGSASPSVTYQIKHSTDRSAAGNNGTTSAAVTSTTTGTDATLSDATVPADSWVWLETTAQSGTVDEMAVFFEYTED